MSVHGITGMLTRERFSGADFQIHEHIRIYQWPDTAWRIPSGSSMGQTFEAHETFKRVGTYLYAAVDPLSTLYRVSLRNGGPAGGRLSSTVVHGSEAYGFPTIWTFLESEGWGPGKYFLEVSEVQGDVRWWSSVSDIYPDGCAYLDGVPVENRDLIFLCAHHETRFFRYDWRLQLEGRELLLGLALIEGPKAVKGEDRFGFEVRVLWVRDGYDVSDPSRVLFKRFETDATQYVPIEQFKRFPIAWPDYQSPMDRPAFPQARWIHAAGSGHCDFRFSDFESTDSWPLHSDSMVLRFPGNRLRIGFLDHNEELPVCIPTFFTSAPGFDETHNALFRERSFGLGSGGAGGEWLEWIGPQSCWVGNPWLERFKQGVAEQRIDEYGYVWSMGYEGGYPHGLRYGMAPRARRHYGSNGAFILGAFHCYAWSRDRRFLEDQTPRLRSAMDFMLDSDDMRWLDDLLVIVEPHHNGTSRGMASTGWDCLPFGYKCALTNAYVERTIRTLKEEEIWLNQYDSYTEAHTAIDAYIRYFNQHRVHSALGYQSPDEFAAATESLTLAAA